MPKKSKNSCSRPTSQNWQRVITQLQAFRSHAPLPSLLFNPRSSCCVPPLLGYSVPTAQHSERQTPASLFFPESKSVVDYQNFHSLGLCRRDRSCACLTHTSATNRCPNKGVPAVGDHNERGGCSTHAVHHVCKASDAAVVHGWWVSPTSDRCTSMRVHGRKSTTPCVLFAGYLGLGCRLKTNVGGARKVKQSDHHFQWGIAPPTFTANV
jgi:hypothetical protein